MPWPVHYSLTQKYCKPCRKQESRRAPHSTASGDGPILDRKEKPAMPADEAGRPKRTGGNGIGVMPCTRERQRRQASACGAPCRPSRERRAPDDPDAADPGQRAKEDVFWHPYTAVSAPAAQRNAGTAGPCGKNSLRPGQEKQSSMMPRTSSSVRGMKASSKGENSMACTAIRSTCSVLFMPTSSRVEGRPIER